MLDHIVRNDAYQKRKLKLPSFSFSKRNIIVSLLILLVVVVGGVAAFFLSKQNQDIREEAAVSETVPITGTFYMFDNFLTSLDDYENYMRELESVGIDKIVVLAIGSFYNEPCDNSKLGTTSVHNSIDDTNFQNFLTKAKQHNMKLYLGNLGYKTNCTSVWNGQVGNISTQKGKFIGENIQAYWKIRDYVNSHGANWNDSDFIAGFYISHEVAIGQYLNDPTVLEYYKDFSRELKNNFSNKKIVVSPYMYENNDYDKALSAFNKFFDETAVDIMSPQDSMGARLTTSFGRDQDHFRALADSVAAHPGREAWANIETFIFRNGDYVPTDIDRLSNQIASASPYVSSMITWIYQHTMNSLPEYDETASWTGQYTKENAIKRSKLKADYLEKYLIGKKIYENTFRYGDNFVIKGDNLGDVNTSVQVLITYLDSSGNIKRSTATSTIMQEDKKTIYISLSQIPGFVDNKDKYSIMFPALVGQVFPVVQATTPTTLTTTPPTTSPNHPTTPPVVVVQPTTQAVSANPPGNAHIKSVYETNDFIVIKGLDFGSVGSVVEIRIRYPLLSLGERVFVWKEYTGNHEVKVEDDDQVILIPQTTLPSFNPLKGLYSIQISEL